MHTLEPQQAKFLVVNKIFCVKMSIVKLIMMKTNVSECFIAGLSTFDVAMCFMEGLYFLVFLLLN